MAGGGTPQTQIATALGISRPTVAKILNKPQVQDIIRAVREAIQLTALKGIKRTTALAYERLHETVQPGESDPKAFQLMANGLAALEKTAASAASLSGLPPGQPPPGDLRAEASELLIAVLRGVSAARGG